MLKINCLALAAAVAVTVLPIMAQDKEMPGNLVRGSHIVGMDVRNSSNENLGDVKEVVLDRDKGTIAYAVISFGGFLNMGDKLFAVPWESLKPSADHKAFVLDVPKDRLEKAPGFDQNSWPNMADAAWANEVRTFYTAGSVTRDPAINPAAGRTDEAVKVKTDGMAGDNRTDNGLRPRDNGAARNAGMNGDDGMNGTGNANGATGQRQIMTRTGTIRSFNRGDASTLVLATSQGDVQADLGPASVIEQNKLALDNGAKITVKGYETTRDGRTSFVVTEVVSNERTIRLRQDDVALANDGAARYPSAAVERTTEVQGMRDLTGTITYVESSPCEESGYGRQVRVRTSDGERVVALAPGNYLDSRRWVLRPQDTITVRGYDYDRNGNRVFIATELKRGNDTWQFRRADGTPLWR